MNGHLLDPTTCIYDVLLCIVDVDECSLDPTLCRGQTHGACYNHPGGYQCACAPGYHPHYYSATGTGSFVCISEYTLL